MPLDPPNRHPLHQSRLYAVHSRAKLAALFGLTRATLDAVLAEERPFSQRTIEIVRNGKTKVRVIQEPRGNVRQIHVVVRKMLTRIEPPEFLFCPVKRRSYVSNAALHAGTKEIRKLDIQAYFPSTPSHRVFWFFHTAMACSPDVAAVLAKLLTVDGHLATGSTVSPILSFFAFYDMWLSVAEIANEAGCLLSVYMDDIAVSGDRVPNKAIWQIKQQVHARELIAHKERHYTGGIGEVTGVLIKQGKLQVPNRQLKKAYDTRIALAAAINPAEITRLSSVLRGLNQQRKQIEG